MKDIKADHGGIAFDNSGVGNHPTFYLQKFSRFGSILNPLLEKIIENYDPETVNEPLVLLPDPDEKLDFNNVHVFAEDIQDCVAFLSVVENQIDSIDDEKPGSKAKFLRSIFKNYKTHKQNLLINEGIDPEDKNAVIKVIRDNSDLLIRSVSQTILSNAEIDLHEYPIEDVEDSASLVICYGFINCRILEKPSDYS